MPDGVLMWFDEKAGEGAVASAGHVYVARKTDVEPRARHAGVRVHFDIARDDGVERALEVVLRAGTRTGHRHSRFGTLTGARRPDTKGAAPFVHAHPEAGLALASHPLTVVRSWALAIAQGERDTALALCSPEVRLHLPGHDLTGRRRLDGWLGQYPALGCRRRPELRGGGEDVEVRWEANGHGVAVPGMRCRVRHGWIVEQWPLVPDRPTVEVPITTAPRRLPIESVASGEVVEEEEAYAHARVADLAESLAEPVLFARVKLERAGDPARERPARAEALLDVNGDAVRAHVAAGTMHEAVDMLQQRLRHQLEHRAERRQARRRSGGLASPGEWRHGSYSPPAPERFERPVDQRELVRLKSFAAEELTPEEAVFDMDQLDYDFYLFRDLATGADSLVERSATGEVLLTRLRPSEQVVTGTALVAESLRVPPRLHLEEAIDYLNASGESFLFYEDALTGRGNVCYLRYDGHYGLITPD